MSRSFTPTAVGLKRTSTQRSQQRFANLIATNRANNRARYQYFIESGTCIHQDHSCLRGYSCFISANPTYRKKCRPKA